MHDAARPRQPTRLLRSLASAIIAGLTGLAIHSVLMLAKNAFGILQGFQPLEDFQRLLGAWTGERLGGLVPYLTGAMLGSFVYAPLHHRLPGRSFWARGLSFALLARGVMATGFFLLAGHGLFGLTSDWK
jgi:hypothetical protein